MTKPVTNDPIGKAILEFEKDGFTENIIVHSDLCEDDILPVEYLFRTFDQMPEIEQKALELAKGDVLEVGSGTGCHAMYLSQNRNLNTFSIDTSKGAIEYLKSKNIPAANQAFLDHNQKQYDTLLILMNGLGLAGSLENLPNFLQHAKTLLKPNGRIIADSSDIRYLFEDDEGGVWVDLTSKYRGEMQFQMKYKDQKSEWFSWLYIDFDTLKEEAEKLHLNATKVLEDDNFHYLVVLENKINV
ncbi:MAG: class I SAM-dependent methyltransferase [Putridiphycobacter sp.]